MAGDSAAHWQRTYAEHQVGSLSWIEEAPGTSLELIAEAGLWSDAAVIDVGGGASRLAAELVERDYSDVTVADISSAALDRARADLGESARRVAWVESDVRHHDFGRRFDLWHDRAAFHFMVDAASRDDYLAVLGRSLKPGGHLILATFGPEGPTECSGLSVDRYDAAKISRTLGADFALISSRFVEHRTPSGRTQQFIYAHMRHQPG